MPAPAAFEQMLLELANRIRLDPAGEFDRIIADAGARIAHDADTTAAIHYFNVNLPLLKTELAALAPVQPLAWSARLADAAADHSALMRDQDVQSHQLPGEAPLGARLRAAGYAFSVGGENIFAYTSSPLHGHDGFIVDWGAEPDGMQTPRGHRDNLMSASYAEMGVSALPDTSPATAVGPWVVTQNLGARYSAGPFLLGVAYADADRDGFYSMGEGRSRLTVAAEGRGSAATGAAGGYALEVGEGVARITLSGAPAAETVVADVRIGRDNVKLDLVDGRRLLTSSDLDLVRGATAITALGVGNVALSGASGAEALTGNAGDNRLDGEEGKDLLHGGDGADEILGRSGADRIYGDGGADWADAGSGGDEVWGGSGADLLKGGTGSDALYGGSGDDFLYGGSQDDRMKGGGGADHLEGGSGNDRANGGTGRDRLYGGSGSDDLRGDTARDELRGGDGHDRLWGGTGNDEVLGGSGDDELSGGSGGDMLMGGGGGDLVQGGADDDAVYGGSGRDQIYGGSGEDMLRGGSAADMLRGGSGNDDARGDAGADDLQGDAGDDRLSGGDQNDALRGGDGRDLLYGGAGDDRLSGDAGADRIYGGSGDDRVTGGAGSDRLRGGSGRDVFYGGDGDGDDDLYGDAGADAFIFGRDQGRDVIHDFALDDRIRFAGGVTVADLTMASDDGDAVLAFAGTTVVIVGHAGLVLDDLIA